MDAGSELVKTSYRGGNWTRKYASFLSWLWQLHFAARTKSENHTFTLSVWWCLEGSTFEDIQSFFDCLLQSLRFSRMSTQFS